MNLFVIKSLLVQNSIELTVLGGLSAGLIYCGFKKRYKPLAICMIWIMTVLWFFDSPLFGFSTIQISPAGIQLDYGILSTRNVILPPGTSWKIETGLSGIRKNKRLHYLVIADKHSMKLKGEKGASLLKDIGASIDKICGHTALRSNISTCR